MAPSPGFWFFAVLCGHGRIFGLELRLDALEEELDEPRRGEGGPVAAGPREGGGERRDGRLADHTAPARISEEGGWERRRDQLAEAPAFSEVPDVSVLEQHG